MKISARAIRVSWAFLRRVSEDGYLDHMTCHAEDVGKMVVDCAWEGCPIRGHDDGIADCFLWRRDLGVS